MTITATDEGVFGVGPTRPHPFGVERGPRTPPAPPRPSPSSYLESRHPDRAHRWPRRSRPGENCVRTVAA